MLYKSHLILGGLYFSVILLPLNHPTLLLSNQIPIFNLYYAWIFTWVLLGALIPDFDQDNSTLKKVDPHLAAVLQRWFYEDEAEITGLKHRKISHRISILLKVILFISFVIIIALAGSIVLYPIIISVLSFILPYADQPDPLYLLGLFLLGITLGIFSHLWLDSTTREGIRGGKWAGDIFTGSITEEYTRVIMSIPGIVLVIIAFICLIFEKWNLVNFFAIISAVLFIFLGVLFRSKSFYKLVLPTKTCEFCESTWFIMKRKDSYVHFWGHPDYLTGPCRKTPKDEIYFHPVKYFPPATRFLLKWYLKLKCYVKKDKSLQL